MSQDTRVIPGLLSQDLLQQALGHSYFFDSAGDGHVDFKDFLAVMTDTKRFFCSVGEQGSALGSQSWRWDQEADGGTLKGT